MKNSAQLINAISSVGKPLTRSVRRGCLLLALGLCVAPFPSVRAVSPPPDGGYFNQNTAEGEDALFSLTSGGFNNTAVGFSALFSNTSGFGNTALGWSALSGNTTGGHNVALGLQALQSNTTGGFNTAIGNAALLLNTTGVNNTAVGWSALDSNTTGEGNTATGLFALDRSTTGSENTATGIVALQDNTTGSNNTAQGGAALQNNTTGNGNVAVGWGAGTNVTTGNNNIALGFHAGTFHSTGSNNIAIGAFGAIGESNTMRLGRHGLQKTTFIAGVSGATVPSGVTVIVDSLGHLGTISSSARYKEAIQPMGRASETILALQPVTFRYKHDLDPNGIPQFGLVAEEVEKVDPDLVARDDQGVPYAVRYDALNAMLLNEFLKEHRRVGDQSDQIAQLNATVKELKSALKAQEAQLNKMSDQMTALKTPSRVAADNP